jgi:hypothetical protein
VFPSSPEGRESRIAVGPFKELTSKSELSLRDPVPSPPLRTETDPVSKTLCFSGYLEFRQMDRVHKPSDSERWPYSLT